MKMKLSGKSIQESLLRHVEKIIFGVALLVLLLLAYGAVGREGIDFAPEELVTASSQAQEAIKQGGKNIVLPPVRPYPEYANQIRKHISVQPYTLAMSFNVPPFRTLGPRPPAKVLAVTKLKATPGVGAVRNPVTAGSMGGYGMSSMAGPYGSAPPEQGSGEAVVPTSPVLGQRWVVLTGLIEDAKQRQTFEELFQETEPRLPQNDQPDYLFYAVERSEVTEAGQSKWTPISMPGDLQVAAIKMWGASMGEVVDPWFLVGGSLAGGYASYGGSGGYESGSSEMPSGSEMYGGYGGYAGMAGAPGAAAKPTRDWKQYKVPMAFPLPPLVNKQWGIEAAHAPEIPLAMRARPGMPGYGGGSGGYGEGSGGYPGSSGYPGYVMGGMPLAPGMAGAVPGAAGQNGQQPIDAGLAGAGISSDLADAIEQGIQNQPLRPGMPGYMGPGAGVPGYGGYGMIGPDGRRITGPDQKLFRFIDFDVEPGKKYQYRVTLGVTNPNYGVEKRNLIEEASGKAQWIASEASEASEVVTVPYDATIYAGTVAASNNPTVEPKAAVVVSYIHMETGKEQLAKFDVARGQYLNFPGQPFTANEKPVIPGGYSDPGSGMMEMGSGSSMYVSGMEALAPPKKDKKKGEEEKDETIDMVTNMLLVDMMGGENLGGDTRSVGRLLLLDPDGRFIVQDELRDKEGYSSFKEPEKKKKIDIPPGMEEYMGSGMDSSMMEGMRGRRPRRGGS